MTKELINARFRLCYICLLLLLSVLASHAQSLESPPSVVKAAFRGDCETMVLDAIGEAKKEIHVAVYTFTRRRIADALIAQRESGVKIWMKVDERQANSEWGRPVAEKLRKAKIKVDLISMRQYRSMHNKFIVIDNETVITGSYNFTSAASKDNWENMVRIEDSAIAREFVREWHQIKNLKK